MIRQLVVQRILKLNEEFNQINKIKNNVNNNEKQKELSKNNMIIDDQVTSNHNNESNNGINIHYSQNYYLSNDISLNDIFQYILSDYESVYKQMDSYLNNIDFQKLCEVKEKLLKEKYFINYVEDNVNQLSFNINGIKKIDKIIWNTLPFQTRLDLINRSVVEKLNGCGIKTNQDLLKNQFLSSILIFSNIQNEDNDNKTNIIYSLNFMSHFKRLGITVNNMCMLSKFQSNYVSYLLKRITLNYCVDLLMGCTR